LNLKPTINTEEAFCDQHLIPSLYIFDESNVEQNLCERECRINTFLDDNKILAINIEAMLDEIEDASVRNAKSRIFSNLKIERRQSDVLRRRKQMMQ
jgi:hypothetical protein